MADYKESIEKYMEAWNTDDHAIPVRLLRDSWVADGEFLVVLLDAPLVGIDPLATFIGDTNVQFGFVGHRTGVVGEIVEHNSCALVSWRTVAPDGTVTLEGQNFFEFEDGLIRRLVGFFPVALPA